ncbi:MAG: hypothetical protein AMXMBFR13_50280 [Phycisphaerae bacterium]
MKLTACLLSIATTTAAMAAPAAPNPVEAHEQYVAWVALSRARITLQQAMEIARSRAPAGVVVEAELGLDGELPIFDVEFLAGPTRTEVRIEAISGKVLKIDTDTEDDADDIRERERTARLVSSGKLSLPEAIAAALREVPEGLIHEAELEIDDGQGIYEIELMKGDRFFEVELDLATGKVLQVEDETAVDTLWSFEVQVSVGKFPEGWVIQATNGPANASWQVVVDRSAPRREHVLALTRTTNRGGTYNLAIARKITARDLDLRVRVRADAGDEDQGGGPVWRYQDENNYYICRINPLESNYRVYKVVNGKRQQLHSADVDLDEDIWYDLRVVMVGEQITCFLDGKPLLEAKDNAIRRPGKVGLWTKADAATSFDNLAILPLDPASARAKQGGATEPAAP